jgi:peptidoglycan/LPS O-acetylase OafA/YrhL
MKFPSAAVADSWQRGDGSRRAGHPSDPRLAFRPDVNGLRAIAVLAVVAFHFQLPGVRAGFIGVDVFFVISGYLMTGIILSRLERGTFSVPGFYADRARRIIPALAVLIALLLVLGWFFFLQSEYFQLARQAASSALFYSNIAYWRGVGYFAPPVDQQWLIHTWSLSLEWQFYLLYPLLLPVLVRAAPRRWRHIVAGAALLSFAATLVLSEVDPAAGFYLLPARAWELLAGGLAYGLPPLSGRAARIAEALGLAAIAAGAVLISPVGWPNGSALVPVAGTLLVILAGRTQSRLTGNRLAAWIGLTSYSIYLWHWPVVVWLRFADRDDPASTAAGMGASLLLGYLSWRLVERRAQPRTERPRIHSGDFAASWRPVAGYGLILFVLASTSLAIRQARGVPQRLPPEVEAITREGLRHEMIVGPNCYATGEFAARPCLVGPPGPPRARVIGDSHADAALLGLVEALPASGGGLAYNAFAACPPVLGAVPASGSSRCGIFNAHFLPPLTRPRTLPLILTADWLAYANKPTVRFPGDEDREPSVTSFKAHLMRSTCALARGGPTYVVLPTPRFPRPVIADLERRVIAGWDSPDVSLPRKAYEESRREVVAVFQQAARSCGVRLLDPAPFLCTAVACPGSMDRRPLYFDESHLTDRGSRLLTPMFRPVLAAAGPSGDSE